MHRVEFDPFHPGLLRVVLGEPPGTVLLIGPFFPVEGMMLLDRFDEIDREGEE